MAESLFQELRDDGIKTAVIYPGSVATKLHEDAEGTAHEMMVQPEDIGETVCHMLATPGNTAIHQLEIRPLRKPANFTK